MRFLTFRNQKINDIKRDVLTAYIKRIQMNQAIANIIKEYIEDLTFVDKIAGLVSTQYMTSNRRGRGKSNQVLSCCLLHDG